MSWTDLKDYIEIPCLQVSSLIIKKNVAFKSLTKSMPFYIYAIKKNFRLGASTTFIDQMYLKSDEISILCERWSSFYWYSRHVPSVGP